MGAEQNVEQGSLSTSTESTSVKSLQSQITEIFPTEEAGELIILLESQDTDTTAQSIIDKIAIIFNEKKQPKIGLDGKPTTVLDTKNGKTFIVSQDKKGENNESITIYGPIAKQPLNFIHRGSLVSQNIVVNNKDYTVVSTSSKGEIILQERATVKEGDSSEVGTNSIVLFLSDNNHKPLSKNKLYHKKEFIFSEGDQYTTTINGVDVEKKEPNNNLKETLIQLIIDAQEKKQSIDFQESTGLITNHSQASIAQLALDMGSDTASA